MQKAGTEKTGASKCSSDKHQAGAAGYKRDNLIEKWEEESEELVKEERDMHRSMPVLQGKNWKSS